MGEYRLKSESVCPEISGRRGRSHQPSSFQNVEGLRMYAQIYFVLSQSTLLTDRRTDIMIIFIHHKIVEKKQNKQNNLTKS